MPGATSALPSTIDRVTVHRRSALVRRTVDVGGLALPSAIHISPLPLTLHPATVRAVIVEPGGDLAGAAAVARVAVEPVGPEPGTDASEPVRAVEAARHTAELAAQEVERLRLDLEAIEEQLEPVARERIPWRDDEVRSDREPVPVERRLALLALRTQQVELLAPALVAAERAQREAERALREASDRLASMRRHEGREHELVATALVAMQGTGSLGAGARLEVSYLVEGATWRPSHRLHVDGERSRLTLGAVVTQHTGEDWHGVALELSTTEPSLHWELPELKPVRIGRAAPVTSRGWRPPAPLPSSLFADFDRAAQAADTAARRAVEPPATPEWMSDQGPITGEVPVTSALLRDDLGDGASAELAVALPVQAPTPMYQPAPPPAVVPPQAMPAARSAAGAGPRSRAWRSAPAGLPGAAPAVPSPGSVAIEPDRPDPAVADLDALVLPPATGGDRGRPRPRGGGTDEAERLTARTRAQAIDELTLPVDAFGVSVACVYGVAAAVDVPSGRDPATVVIDDAPLSVEHAYVAVPYQSTDVFRTLVLTNPFDQPLAAGPLEVSGPGGYLGPAALPTVAPRATARVGMGIEDAIRVERQVEHRDDAKGLVRSSRVLEHDVTVRLTNGLTEPVTVEVRERVPTVPDTEDRASVEELVIDPPWQPYTRPDAILRGGRRWTVPLAPSSTSELRARWQIVVPAKFELDGGNRR